MNRPVCILLHLRAPEHGSGWRSLTDGIGMGYACPQDAGMSAALQHSSTCNAEGAGEPSPVAEKTGGFMFHGGFRHERGLRDRYFSWSHMHYVGRSFRLLNPTSRPSLRLRSVFPAENFTMRKFSAGNRRENAETRRDGRTLMRKGKLLPVW